MAPRTHEPLHAPPLQTNSHGWVPIHCPAALHVCGTLPSHCLLFGRHIPQMPAPTQRAGQGSSSWNLPSAPHV